MTHEPNTDDPRGPEPGPAAGVPTPPEVESDAESDAGGVDAHQQEVQQILQGHLDHTFGDPDLLVRALTHRSYAFEAGGIADNERLEFLGDAVLGLAVTSEIFARLPKAAEGRLAKVRAASVSTVSLAKLARTIDLGDAVRLGVGEEQSGGRDKDSILANTTEAVIGAVYLDAGIEVATRVVLHLMGDMLDEVLTRRESLDYKTSLQELTAGELSTLPQYKLSDVGPDHAKTFTAVVVVGGETLGEGQGRSKKEAEQRAAREAYRVLHARLHPDDGDTDPTEADTTTDEEDSP